MSDKITLIIAIHNHQPVGNFRSVLKEANRKSYLPFLKVLSKHPHLKLNLHFSGFLLRWLLKNSPKTIKLLKKLIKNKQVCILGGGMYEPVLSSITISDARQQLRLLNLLLKKTFGVRPNGFWLTERVWEPQIPELVAGSGLKFSFVDDNHFVCAGFDKEKLDGYYITESNAKKLFVFPINEDLRYLVPFKKVNKVINYLHTKKKEGIKCITLAADGEKFGVWPSTYNWVYKKDWLNRFFKALKDNEDWIEIKTASSFIRENPPTGLSYLPTASYDKMMRWSLPTETKSYFEKVTNILKRKHEYKKALPFLRRGLWENFFVKYPEANAMHKRMLMVSKKKKEIKNKKSKSYKKALDFLYRCQCNDAYWHGLFGGLYLPHLREAIYENLIAAENLFSPRLKRGSFSLEQTDFNCDARKEVILRSRSLGMFFEPAYGGSLCELDLRKKNINLINTLSRKKEVYDKKRKNKNVIDRHLRKALQEHILKPSTTLRQFKGLSFEECGDFINQPYRLIKKSSHGLGFKRKGNIELKGKFFPLSIEKDISFLKESEIRVVYRVLNNSKEKLNFIFGSESNFSIYPSYKKRNYFECGAGKKSLAKTSAIQKINRISLIDRKRNIKLNFALNRKACLWYCPIFTSFQSEGSLEKIFQCGSFLIHWLLALDPAEEWGAELRVSFK